jgi:hypothetical protein
MKRWRQERNNRDEWTSLAKKAKVVGEPYKQILSKSNCGSIE